MTSKNFSTSIEKAPGNLKNCSFLKIKNPSYSNPQDHRPWIFRPSKPEKPESWPSSWPIWFPLICKSPLLSPSRVLHFPTTSSPKIVASFRQDVPNSMVQKPIWAYCKYPFGSTIRKLSAPSVACHIRDLSLSHPPSLIAMISCQPFFG